MIRFITYTLLRLIAKCFITTLPVGQEKMRRDIRVYSQLSTTRRLPQDNADLGDCLDEWFELRSTIDILLLMWATKSTAPNIHVTTPAFIRPTECKHSRGPQPDTQMPQADASAGPATCQPPGATRLSVCSAASSAGKAPSWFWAWPLPGTASSQLQPADSRDLVLHQPGRLTAPGSGKSSPGSSP